ncbi:hypothetical protein VCNHCC008D_002292B, partial [Vibrio cholerae O1 str. NHCC-008D]
INNLQLFHDFFRLSS